MSMTHTLRVVILCIFSKVSYLRFFFLKEMHVRTYFTKFLHVSGKEAFSTKPNTNTNSELASLIIVLSFLAYDNLAIVSNERSIINLDAAFKQINK